MHAQIHHRQIRGTRLRLLSIRLHIAAYSSPRIDLIRKVNRQHEIIESDAVKVGTLRRAVIGILLAAGARPCCHRRIVVRTSVAESRSRLLILRDRGFQILVRNVDLLLQSIQLRVLKDLPPVPAEVLVVRLGSLPISHLLVRWRSRHCRPFVSRSYCTAGGRQCAGNNQNGINDLPRPRDQLNQALHWGSPGRAACTIVTSSPDTKESGGFKTTWSSALRPATISI